MANPIADAVTGLSYLPRGLTLLARRPRLLSRGVVPPILTSILNLAALIALVLNAPALASAATPFLRDSSSAEGLRALVAVLVIACGVLLMVVTFSALTLAIGGPIYDTIAEALERELGEAPQPPAQRFVTTLGRTVGQALILVLLGVVLVVVVFWIGLIPVLGSVVAAALGACLGGWLVALDLVGTVFERRGLVTLRDRHRRLVRRPMLTLGFCVPTFLLLSLPLLAIAVFPVAKAGATLLARESLGETTTA